MTHTLYPGMPTRALTREIVDSKMWLEDALQIEVSKFAGPFSSDLLDPRSLEMIASHYSHNFVTFPRRQATSDSGHIVWRTNLESRWTTGMQEYALRFSCFEDARYRRRRSRLLSDFISTRRELN